MSEQDNNDLEVNSQIDAEQVRENCLWAMGAHLVAFAGLAIPFGNLLGPFIIWQIKKDIPYIADHAKESLNFQITLAMAFLVCAILSLVLIGIFLALILGVAAVVLVVIAAIKANADEDYQYPFTLRLIK